MAGLRFCVFLLGVVGAEIVTLDMSYEYKENVTMYWNPKNAIRRTPEYRVGWYEEGFWLASYNFFTTEHGGTHLDSPYHFAENGRTIEQIKLPELLRRPAVKIDIAARAKTDPDTMVTVEDLEMWEKKHGRIPDGAAVLMYSGWHEKYGDWKAFMGTQSGFKGFDVDSGKVNVRHFPGFCEEAMDWLCTQRNISGVGVDTASIDRGFSKDYRAHISFSLNDKWGLEMVANLKDLPEHGALLSVLPMKITGGTGAPSRVFATWNTEPNAATTLRMRGSLSVTVALIISSLIHLVTSF